MRLLESFLILAFVAVALWGCGRGPSPLLRSGIAPIYDFPLYVSSGDGTGTVWKFEEDGSKTAFVSGLNDPRGVATDKFNNLYVVETGASQLLKFNMSTKEKTIVATGLSIPSVVAVDSFGDAYVTQEGLNNIVRASDGHVLKSYSGRATALAFGVNDLLLVGLYDDNMVFWGAEGSAPSASVVQPVMIATDGNGRVFVAEGKDSGAKVYRFHQRTPDAPVTVADGLNGATGIAVDSVGNIYISEPGASRIILVTYDQELYSWATLSAPQYLTFTQY